jgi:hypothetical protein
MKELSFIPTNSELSVTGHTPKPAVAKIPSWFKKMPRYPDGKFASSGLANIKQTVKACSPFLDAFSMGYVISLEADVLVKRVADTHQFEWLIGGTLISLHSQYQVAPDQIPAGFSTIPYKFENQYIIKTPKGYSSLIMHPLNRTDLPFITMAGVVDTDNYDLQINFPFLLRDDFEGILEAGTPIAQVIPIKRETWGHKILGLDLERAKIAYSKVKHKIVNGYKSQFWNRKDYK